MSAEDRRRQIVDTAIQVILQRGLAQASTRDVTRAIGVGSGLLHHYFSSWSELRAAAVRRATEREMEELGALIAPLAPADALDRIADWMVEDDDMAHWRLWLNAQDEAHRDDLLAEVMNKALSDWHTLIASLLRNFPDVADPDVQLAAWRLIAMMDGLASAMLIRGSIITRQQARELIGSQLDIELRRIA